MCKKNDKKCSEKKCTEQQPSTMTVIDIVIPEPSIGQVIYEHVRHELSRGNESHNEDPYLAALCDKITDIVLGVMDKEIQDITYRADAHANRVIENHHNNQTRALINEANSLRQALTFTTRELQKYTAPKSVAKKPAPKALPKVAKKTPTTEKKQPVVAGKKR